ncbi:GGDEF domain-containing response regulator [Pararhodospirillum photometricum]|uniref:diguanylate cyclase n=1 Tax=Pararhodospirillum photometricum DSM 122 TaxID=1150469 RepID=H6SNN2_PARPM|nr:diguanylate cyclase [Pararhodospirillum photometricum]CCG09363.1 Response regulator [Pararhodospirillum photometricum DSM 122]
MTDAKPFRLLLVDDDEASLDLLASLVAHFGTLARARTGAEALAEVASHLPDLILLDAEIPSPNGFEVCEILKTNPLYADLPILFVTAHNAPEIETLALRLGAVDFIHKPLNPAIVRARVRTHLLLKQRTDDLHRLAIQDPLTRLANRRAFDDALDQEIRRARRNATPLSLLMLDVDYFKRYNDHYGHPKGDEALRAVAGVLARYSRRAGEMAARLGGEEFAVLLPGLSADTATLLAERIRASVIDLGLPHAFSDVAPVLSVSLGVAAYEPEGTALTDCADQALYAAKKAGRNCVSAA